MLRHDESSGSAVWPLGLWLGLTEVKVMSRVLKTWPEGLSSPGSVWLCIMLMTKLKKMMRPKVLCHSWEVRSR